jgi:cytochrome c553
MKKLFRLVMPAAAFAAALMLTGGAAFATKEMSKKEKKPCTTCHVKMGSKDLNDVGKFYKEKKTLDGAPTK